MIGKTAQMSVSSRARITFIDMETGERVPAINAETGEEVWGGDWHPNMITDAGLDRIAGVPSPTRLIDEITLSGSMPEIKERSGSITASQSGATVTASAAFFQAADVGRAIVWDDGSNARITSFTSATEVQVDVTQVVPEQPFERWHVEISAVPGFVQRGNTGASEVIADYDDDHWIFRIVSWRQVELSAASNVNGFGLGPNQQWGRVDAAIIECIRDASGNPITVSLLAGKAVRVDHELTMRYPRASKQVTVQIDEYDAGNQLIGTSEHVADLWGAPSNLTNLFGDALLSVLWPGNLNINSTTVGYASRFLASRFFTPGDLTSGNPNYAPNSSQQAFALSDYTARSRRRTKTMTAAAAHANGNVHGAMFRNGSSSSIAALVLQFQEGEAMVKESSHTLTLGFEVSWDRDYTVS